MSANMEQPQPRFPLSMQILHWLMVAMVLSMLAIGFTMVVSLAYYHRLLAIHRPLGIAVLAVVVIRFINRHFSTLPPFPETMSARERTAASTSERVFYALMFLLPLVGWGMLSAAGYPIVLYGSLHLPPILPHSALLYAMLRKTHTILAYLLLFTFFGHFSAILFHTLVIRDGMLGRMLPWKFGSRLEAASE